VPAGTRRWLLTTQPGWEIAVIAEMRAGGVPGRFATWHRGSSVVVPETVLGRGRAVHDLATPATVYQILLEVRADAGGDVLSAVLGALRSVRRSDAFKEALLGALHGAGGRGQRRYSIATEIFGRLAVNRGQLAGAIEAAVNAAFPRWRRAPDAGARLLCKADPEYAVLAVQTATNLSADQGLRAGSLREHLAASLLTLVGAAPGVAVFDPFMGTGTILRAAARRFGVASCYGLEVERDAFSLARQRLSDDRYRLFNTRFEAFACDRLPAGTRLVSNIPFGHRFARMATPPLIDMIASPAFAAGHTALLMSREQAAEVASATRLRARNVLVLGQPAAIAYG
jgi:hypothetical protein